MLAEPLDAAAFALLSFDIIAAAIIATIELMPLTYAALLFLSPAQPDYMMNTPDTVTLRFIRAEYYA